MWLLPEQISEPDCLMDLKPAVSSLSNNLSLWFADLSNLNMLDSELCDQKIFMIDFSFVSHIKGGKKNFAAHSK